MLQKFTKKKTNHKTLYLWFFGGGGDNNVSHNRDKLIVNA